MTLAGKTFRAVANSANGTIGTDTTMLYHCVTTSGELKAGQASARFTTEADRRHWMKLDWQWLTGDRTSGRSEWILESEG
jgi:hypothetical protein